MMHNDYPISDTPSSPLNSSLSGWQPLLPWLAGSGIAMGQALLATRCTVSTLGKCVGCGSCIVAVAGLSTWAMKRRKADAQRTAQSGLEPFEVKRCSPHSAR